MMTHFHFRIPPGSAQNGGTYPSGYMPPSQSLYISERSGFPECGAEGLLAVAGAAALNIHMLRRTFVILIVGTLGSLAVNTDIAGGVTGAVGVRIAGSLSGEKALAAGLVLTAGMSSAHHDVPLGAQSFLVVGTVFHSTF